MARSSQRVLALVGESTAPPPAHIRSIMIIAPLSRSTAVAGIPSARGRLSSDDIVSTHPIIFAQALYTREVSVYRHITGRSSHLPVPRFYGSFEAILPSGRPVYVVLLEHIPGATLQEDLRDYDDDAIRADQALLRAGIYHRDLAGRNFVRRRDRQIAVIDFGDADIAENGQQSDDEDVVMRWAGNEDFVAAGYIPDPRGGGDPGRACLKMVRDVEGGG
ncbi:hypothetical protein BZA05DRAFT_459898 [Tricharina praecox]|uniref:uncharacterized protein n=1 Tax=Tricharina praecox TaxID=43433 RepID=UPI00221ED972|nr:uncharacterized protein BZA05DRAFT_459898 [Tricharina praecox]KAI5856851.1 hypothetical protein BZA05DRAFT_459898 [Tricharina praecox]